MANGDTANYTLRYNEITQALEGSFGLNWEALVLSNTVPPTDITSALLTGFVQVSGVVTASDTILTAFEKLSFATQGGISGEVPYSSGGTLAYDPNFIWNGTTHRLGIGDQPNFDLDIQKTTGASGTVSGSVTNLATTGNALWQAVNNLSHTVLFGIGGATNSGFPDTAFLYNSNAANGLIISSQTGAVGLASGGIVPQVSLSTAGYLTINTGVILSSSGNAINLAPGGSQSLTVQTNGVTLFQQAPQYPISNISGSGTVSGILAIDGPTFYTTVTGALTLGGPTGGYDGQKITFRLLQDSTGHTVTFATGSGNFSFGTTITSFTASGANLTDYVGAIYNSVQGTWNIVSVSQGF
jgi:hypothetical protein